MFTPVFRVVRACGLLLVIGHLAVAEPVAERWEEEVARIEAREQAAPPPAGAIVFTGSSSIRLWKSLAEDFPQHAVVNRGFGGSQISDLIAYFDRLVTPGQPRQIVIYSGTNDLSAGEEPAQVLADLATLSGMIRAALPDAKLAWISAAPNPARWSQREAQQQFNGWARAYCERMGYDFIDVWEPMLGEGGEPTRDIYIGDKLHMNDAGYVIWREVVGPYLIETK